MHSDGIAAISHHVASLDIDNAPTNPVSFTGYESAPPPAPKLQSKGVIASDITEQFRDAAQKLDVGQLIKDPYFTLFESVSALEIMDPKMDSGCLEPDETLEDDYDFSKPLLPEEVLGIIDQLLCHEMAWHKGHPLSQTIFTSLYIDKLLVPIPLNLAQTGFNKNGNLSSDESLILRVLRAYCLGLIKTCWYVNNRIKSEHYFEEEDFVTHTFNRNLLEGISQDAILQFINETIHLLSQTDTINPELNMALSSRLQFRARFLTVVDIAELRTSMEVKSHWTELLSCIPDLRKSVQLGKPVPSSFSVKLQRNLASTVPPRPIVEVSQEAAFDHLERLCKDGRDVVDVLEYYDSHSLLAFVSLFQARKPQPSVYIRTLLQHYLFSDMVVLGKMSVRQILDDDLASIVLPAHKLLDPTNDEVEHPSDPRFNMANRMEIFRSRAAQSYLDIARTLCQNRCRIRRTLCHSITDWDTLQFDAEELDQQLREFTKEEPTVDPTISYEPIYGFHLSSWAYFYKLQQMEWVIQLGFELETYQPNEFAGMYWYLQYVAKNRSRHLERIKGVTVRSYSASQRSNASAQSKLADLAEFEKSVSFVNFSMLDAASTYGFADGLSILFTVLSRLSLMTSPSRPYSDDLMRYELRMKPFLSIGLPEVLPYDEFISAVTQPRESTLDLLNFAGESIAAAKRGFEMLSKLNAEDAYCQGSHDSWVKNVKDCLKACIFAGIAVSGLKKAVEKAGQDGKLNIRVEIPESEKGYHPWWIVPKVMSNSS